mgnify:FL=1
MYIICSGCANSSFVSGSSFTNNIASQAGGAMWFEGATPKVVASTFSNNQATYGGDQGSCASTCVSLLMSGCIFVCALGLCDDL